ncbi:hypothetical protein GCM10023320_62860 [Pseudonocardia adelaidensis]|uniref:Uncharacterized protein n=1 Tax=Pseudonocardia adelaidensis TaxID=648754 RepID=A0ABP9NVD2_9PSEU
MGAGRAAVAAHRPLSGPWSRKIPLCGAGGPRRRRLAPDGRRDALERPHVRDTFSGEQVGYPVVRPREGLNCPVDPGDVDDHRVTSSPSPSREVHRSGCMSTTVR